MLLLARACSRWTFQGCCHSCAVVWKAAFPQQPQPGLRSLGLACVWEVPPWSPSHFPSLGRGSPPPAAAAYSSSWKQDSSVLELSCPFFGWGLLSKVGGLRRAGCAQSSPASSARECLPGERGAGWEPAVLPAVEACRDRLGRGRPGQEEGCSGVRGPDPGRSRVQRKGDCGLPSATLRAQGLFWPSKGLQVRVVGWEPPQGTCWPLEKPPVSARTVPPVVFLAWPASPPPRGPEASLGQAAGHWGCAGCCPAGDPGSPGGVSALWSGLVALAANAVWVPSSWTLGPARKGGARGGVLGLWEEPSLLGGPGAHI